MNHHYYNKLRKVIQSYFQCNKARIKYITVLIISLIDVATVNLQRVSLKINSNAKTTSNYRNLQRFFQNFKMNYEEYARFVVSMLPKAGKYYLVMDRTNWKYGKRDINILMLGIIYKNTALPLYWMMLDKGGSSNTWERKQLLGKAIVLFGKERIAGLLCDREFIGVKWFKYLIDQEIEFHIRIPKQVKQGSVLKKNRKIVNYLFRFLKENGKLDYPKQVSIFGFKLYVSGMKSKKGYCVVVSNKSNFDSLKKYQMRWTIENLFGSFKTRGFNFEDTHFKNLDKIKLLIVIISIAYLWSILIGIWLDASTPIKLKKHGRKSISIFRYGFDYLVRVIKSIYDNLFEFNNLVKILSCT